MKTVWLTALASFVMSVAALGQENVWDGTWKLNEARSYTPGPNFVVEQTSTGEYIFSDGTLSYRFFCNGREYPAGKRTVACVASTPKSMDLVWRQNGVQIALTHRELSLDERTTLTTGVHLVGSKETFRTTYVRLSGTRGFAGSWKNADGAVRGPRILVTGLKDSVLHIGFPPSKQYADIKIDGTDAPIEGVEFSKAATLSARANGTRQFLTAKKVNGVVTQEGTLTLSGDGRTVVEEWWIPARPDVKGKHVYDKHP